MDEASNDRAEGSGYPFEATDKQRKAVETMVAYGVPQAEICRALEIDPKTLRKHFRDELDQAVHRANAKIAERLYRAAMDGSVGAMIFWLKARAKWRERHEVSGPDGAPVPFGPITIVHVPPERK